MKNNYKLIARIFIPACLLFVLSCNKILDIKDLLNNHNNDKLCKVSKITSSFYGTAPNPLISQFAYNKKGNPISVSFNFVATGHPNLIFRYDRYGHLSDYAGIYSGAGYEFWFHYQYQGNRIVSDSGYFFGRFSGDTLYPNPSRLVTEQYQYDNLGRISRVARQYPNAAPPGVPDTFYFYFYDNNGNLTGSSAYDNKVNIHRASDVWMFVDRDYSVNNPIPATSYNAKGFPLIFNQASTEYTRFVSIDISSSTIEYQCSND